MFREEIKIGHSKNTDTIFSVASYYSCSLLCVKICPLLTVWPLLLPSFPLLNTVLPYQPLGFPRTPPVHSHLRVFAPALSPSRSALSPQIFLGLKF